MYGKCKRWRQARAKGPDSRVFISVRTFASRRSLSFLSGFVGRRSVISSKPRRQLRACWLTFLALYCLKHSKRLDKEGIAHMHNKQIASYLIQPSLTLIYSTDVVGPISVPQSAAERKVSIVSTPSVPRGVQIMQPTYHTCVCFLHYLGSTEPPDPNQPRS